MTASVFKLIPAAQKYDWGKPAASSSVAHYAKASGINVDAAAPYAELWMGTHPSAPSLVAPDRTPLSDHLKKDPSLIGKDILAKYQSQGADAGNLPFLLKILAIEKALSIQTHPDKKTAEALHKERPDVYKDDNHKPEMALAITPFTAMCGFRPLPELAAAFRDTPELAALVPEDALRRFLDLVEQSNSQQTTDAEKAALREVFTAIMSASESTFKPQLDALVKRYEASNASADPKIRELVLRLNSQFPGDIGVFCAFLLNYIELQPGEAIYLGAGEPHAYVSGDIVECMATSDNVIRAGLTPKLRDIPNLVSGLTYAAAPPSFHTVKPRAFAGSQASTLYDPPAPEFAVLQTKLDAGQKESQRSFAGPSVGIVTKGDVEVKGSNGSVNVKLTEGEVFFVGSGTDVEVVSGTDGSTVYRAFVEA